jgi:hypothetical protein
MFIETIALLRQSNTPARSPSRLATLATVARDFVVCIYR